MSIAVNKLPEQIRVSISREDDVFVAELPEYDTFTEAHSLDELHAMINDVIYELFQIPKNLQKQINYIPNSRQKSREGSSLLTVMTTPEIFRTRINACWEIVRNKRTHKGIAGS